MNNNFKRDLDLSEVFYEQTQKYNRLKDELISLSVKKNKSVQNLLESLKEAIEKEVAAIIKRKFNVFSKHICLIQVEFDTDVPLGIVVFVHLTSPLNAEKHTLKYCLYKQRGYITITSENNYPNYQRYISYGDNELRENQFHKIENKALIYEIDSKISVLLWNMLEDNTSNSNNIILQYNNCISYRLDELKTQKDITNQKTTIINEIVKYLEKEYSNYKFVSVANFNDKISNIETIAAELNNKLTKIAMEYFMHSSKQTIEFKPYVLQCLMQNIKILIFGSSDETGEFMQLTEVTLPTLK